MAPLPKPKQSLLTPTIPVIAPPNGSKAEGVLWVSTLWHINQSLSKLTAPALSVNKDTQNLIDTQKQLIETLNNMGPALKDGKQIMDTFKNYFGSEKDIDKAIQYANDRACEVVQKKGVTITNAENK